MNTQKLITLLQTEKAGFKLVQTEADKALAAMSPADALQLAEQMYQSDAYQARMFAVLIFGRLAATQPDAYAFLQQKVVLDPDWRTQEMLARAFDQYCKDIGYEQSLSEIKAWLRAKAPNQRRAASEGLRIWTSRPYFRDHPEAAIALLAAFSTPGLGGMNDEQLNAGFGPDMPARTVEYTTLVQFTRQNPDTQELHDQFSHMRVTTPEVESPHDIAWDTGWMRLAVSS